MSANLIKERRLSKPNRFHASQTGVNQCKRAEPLGWYSIPSVTDDEMKFVVRAAIWMAVLGMTPLFLFHIITFCDPDFFLIPVAPH